ncbi:hypothetical protein OH492_07890 [Vibrio chagasii]|nr:hypothetical protein [Vibrio chagasii]
MNGVLGTAQNSLKTPLNAEQEASKSLYESGDHDDDLAERNLGLFKD